MPPADSAPPSSNCRKRARIGKRPSPLIRRCRNASSACPTIPLPNRPPLPMEKINLQEKLSKFSAHWSPKIVTELNGQHVKLVKFRGEFVWHHHEHEDELFYVVSGSFKMELRDRTVELREGEMFVVPRGVEHRPVADEEV